MSSRAARLCPLLVQEPHWRDRFANPAETDLLHQNGKGPGGLLGDGEIRSAIAQHGLGKNILQNRLRLTNILPKSLWGLGADQLVRVAERRHLVAHLGNATDKFGMPLGHPAKDKECCPDIFLHEDVEEPFSRSLHTALELVPVASPHRRVER